MKKRTLGPAKKRLFYALIGSSLFWQYPVYAADDAAQPPSEQTAQETAAADDAAQREFTLKGVEVTATKDKKDTGYAAKRSSVSTKTDTPLNETAQSISVVTREQMEARAVQTLDEAIAYTPGVNPSTYAKDARGYSYTVIRGFGSNVYSTFTDGLRSPVGFFATANTDPYAFDRIEILRGPASILYGANSPGGLINQVTKQPPEKELHEVQLQVGNNSNKSIALDVGGPVQDDGKLLFRLTARTQDQDFEQDYTSGKSTLIAPALTWKPDDATKLTLLATYQKTDIKGNSFGGRTIYATDNILYGYPSTLFIGEPGYDRFEREQKEIGYIFEHQFNDMWSVKQTARHTDINISLKYLDVNGIDSDGRTLNRVVYYFPETLSADAIDTHFQAKWSNGAWAHTTLVGFDYLRKNYDVRMGYGVAPSLDLITLNYGQTVATPATSPFVKSNMSQRGLYLQDQVKFSDRWVFLAGGRRDWYEDDGNSIKQTANTGRAGVVYHATKELSPYFSYSESFEAQSGADRYGNAFVPTTGTQYELGVQYEPTGSNARFTAALFDLRQQNVLTADPLNEVYSGPDYNVQTGEVTSKGLELEAQLTPVKGLNIIAAYTLLDNKTTKSNDITEIGKHTAGIAKHLASLWTDYTLQEGKLKGLGFGGGLRYIGSRYNSANTVKYSGVVVTDAMVRYDLDEWRLALNVRNLFDKFYNVGTGYAGEGRTVLLTATRHW